MPSDAMPVLEPVLCVGASGRTGSTLLMGMLASMPEIALDRVPPYEEMHLTHVARLATTWSTVPLVAPVTAGHRLGISRRRQTAGRLVRRRVADRLDPPPGQSLRRALPPAPGIPPPPHRVRDDSLLADPSSRRAADRMLVDGWRTLAELLAEGHQQRSGHPARWYAEKAPLWLPELLGDRVAHRMLHRVRDPRDAWISTSAFFGKRRRIDARTRRRMLNRFVDRHRSYLSAIAELDPSPDVLLVRYEDAVDDPTGSAQRVAAWLHTTLDEESLHRTLSASLGGHQTAASTQASVERWRTELAAQERDVLETALGPLLATFGYAVD